MNRILPYLLDQNPGEKIIGAIEAAWVEFWNERFPADLKRAMSSDNKEVLKGVFISGYAYGASAKEK